MAARWKRAFLLTVVVSMVVIIFASSIFAVLDSGQVSTAIESTWRTAATQTETVTNNVTFPVVGCVLAILLFVKLAMVYFDYRKHGEFDFAPVAILFFGLVSAITAPTYIWNILGI